MWVWVCLSAGSTATGKARVSQSGLLPARGAGPWLPGLPLDPGPQVPSSFSAPSPPASLAFQGFGSHTPRSSLGTSAPSPWQRPKSPSFHTCETGREQGRKVGRKLGPRDLVRGICLVSFQEPHPPFPSSSGRPPQAAGPDARAAAGAEGALHTRRAVG